MIGKDILEYKVEFIYKPIDKLLWCDNFELNEDWSVLRVRNRRIIEKVYKNKIPFIKPNNEYDIALYYKNKWIYLYENNSGKTTMYKDSVLEIPNLEIIEQKMSPYISYYTFHFDLNILLIIIRNYENISILERKIKTDETKILFYNDQIEIKNSILIYRGITIERFYKFCEELEQEYILLEKEIGKIYSKFNLSINYKSYESISILTWYRAKRENQLEWPQISLEKPKNKFYLEFPKNSGIYYYSDKYVNLARRNDYNPEKYIPKISNKDHSETKDSILYCYLNNIEYISPSIFPNSIKRKFKISRNFRKKKENDTYIEIDFEGNAIEGHVNAKYIMYNNYILKEIDTKEIKIYKGKIPELQILNKHNQRSLILINNKLVNSCGYKLIGVKTFPWYYKQIIHDYNKLGRLEKGDYTDLSHIGIVDEKGTDIITFPIEEELFVSTTLETHRLTTFKNSTNMKVNYIHK